MIACVNFYEPQVVELVNSEVPVVTIDHVFNNRMAILSDNVFGLKALVRQAWACGHRRIAFIHGEKTAVTENRVAGSIRPAKSLAEDPGSLCAGASTMMRPLCRRDQSAAGASAAAYLHHLPGRFLRAGRLQRHQRKRAFDPGGCFGDGLRRIYLSRVVKPQLVTYQQNTAALGRTAADKLIELIEHPRVTLPEQIRVSGKLLDGGSVSIL